MLHAENFSDGSVVAISRLRRSRQLKPRRRAVFAKGVSYWRRLWHANVWWEHARVRSLALRHTTEALTAYGLD
jgi:hypothetical protein